MPRKHYRDDELCLHERRTAKALRLLLTGSTSLSNILSKSGDLQCNFVLSSYAGDAGTFTQPLQPLACVNGGYACANNSLGCCYGRTTAIVDDRPLYARSENATVENDTLLARRGSKYISCPKADVPIYEKSGKVDGIDLALCRKAKRIGPDYSPSEWIDIYEHMVDGKPRCWDGDYVDGGNVEIANHDPNWKTEYLYQAVKPTSCDNGAVQCPNHPFACCIPKGK